MGVLVTFDLFLGEVGLELGRIVLESRERHSGIGSSSSSD